MLENKGSGSLNNDIEGDTGEFIVDDKQELDDNELLDEFGDMLMNDELDIVGEISFEEQLIFT